MCILIHDGPEANFLHSPPLVASPPMSKEVPNAPPRVAHSVRHDTPCNITASSNPDPARGPTPPMHIGRAVPFVKNRIPRRADPLLPALRAGIRPLRLPARQLPRRKLLRFQGAGSDR